MDYSRLHVRLVCARRPVVVGAALRRVRHLVQQPRAQSVSIHFIFAILF